MDTQIGTAPYRADVGDGIETFDDAARRRARRVRSMWTVLTRGGAINCREHTG